MAIELNGILLPITTPFTPEENSTPRTGTQSRPVNGSGIDGYVVLGSTGERANLDEDEYLK